MSDQSGKIMLGWREWLSLPELGIPAIKAKVDTGAKTSALHAFEIDTITEQGIEQVRFKIHPLQKRSDLVLTCQAPIVDRRKVSDSGGHREMRYVIRTKIKIGSICTEAEFTLTDRDSMQFRMLLGRTAMNHIFTVDPSSSYLEGRKPGTPYQQEEMK